MSGTPPVVPVFLARDLAQADIVTGRLRAAGIDAAIEDESGVQMLDRIVAPGHAVVVTVAAGDAESARALLDRIGNADDSD